MSLKTPAVLQLNRFILQKQRSYYTLQQIKEHIYRLASQNSKELHHTPASSNPLHTFRIYPQNLSCGNPSTMYTYIYALHISPVPNIARRRGETRWRVYTILSRVRAHNIGLPQIQPSLSPSAHIYRQFWYTPYTHTHYLSIESRRPIMHLIHLHLLCLDQIQIRPISAAGYCWRSSSSVSGKYCRPLVRRAVSRSARNCSHRRRRRGHIYIYIYI